MPNEKPVYVQINRKIWNTTQFRGLSREARELFFYLTTCPHGNMLGIFVLRPGYALDDLQWGPDRKRFMEPFKELLDKRLFKHDPKTDIILDMEQISKHPPINPNQVIAAIKITNSLPKTPLFQDLKLLAESLGKSFIEPLTKRLGERYAHPETETETETETAITKVIGTTPQGNQEPKPPLEEKPKITPVPKSRHHQKETTEAEKKELQELIQQVATLYPYDRYKFNPLLWIQNHIKDHPLAIIQTFRRLIEESERGTKITIVRAYADIVVEEITKTMNADDVATEAQGYKGPPTAKGMAKISQIMAGMGRNL